MALNTDLIILNITLTGTAPLLCHNERLANPFDELTKGIKEITAKRTRQTEEDRLEVGRLEWLGGLYWSPRTGPYIPGKNLKRCLMEAASLSRDGQKVKLAVTPMDAEIPILYDGPRTADEMWTAQRFVDVRGVRLNGRTKVQRHRPRFEEWGLETSLRLNVRRLTLEDCVRYIREAGSDIGLGDYRPTMGRFDARIFVDTEEL